MKFHMIIFSPSFLDVFLFFLLPSLIFKGVYRFPSFVISFLVDGGWSDWGNWTRCSVTCRNGTQIRTRTCTNPPPQFNGKECQGKLEDGRPCMEQEKCPSEFQ